MSRYWLVRHVSRGMPTEPLANFEPHPDARNLDGFDTAKEAAAWAVLLSGEWFIQRKPSEPERDPQPARLEGTL